MAVVGLCLIGTRKRTKKEQVLRRVVEVSQTRDPIYTSHYNCHSRYKDIRKLEFAVPLMMVISRNHAAFRRLFLSPLHFCFQTDGVDEAYSIWLYNPSTTMVGHLLDRHQFHSKNECVIQMEYQHLRGRLDTFVAPQTSEKKWTEKYDAPVWLTSGWESFVNDSPTNH